jgi:hypothetical protein
MSQENERCPTCLSEQKDTPLCDRCTLLGKQHFGNHDYCTDKWHDVPPQPAPDLAERYVPNPRSNYVCAYCNETARLMDAGVVVDSYQNVIHLACFDKEVSWRLKEPLPHRAELAQAPAPSAAVTCEHCGNEVFEGHYSVLCHKPGCYAARAAQPDTQKAIDHLLAWDKKYDRKWCDDRSSAETELNAIVDEFNALKGTR